MCRKADRLGQEPELSQFWSSADYLNDPCRSEPIESRVVIVQQVSGRDTTNCVGDPQERFGLGPPVVPIRNSPTVCESVQQSFPVALIAECVTGLNDQMCDTVISQATGVDCEQVTASGNLAIPCYGPPEY